MAIDTCVRHLKLINNFFFVCRDLHQYRIRTCQSCLGRLLKLPIVLGSNPEAVAVVMMGPSDNS
jgi:hypothetical protein